MKVELSRRVKFAETLEINDFRRFFILAYSEVCGIADQFKKLWGANS